MNRLEGKVAVITGATSGMGLAAARLFVSEGAFVFITGRRQAKLEEAVQLIGSNVMGVQGDVASSADLKRLYEVVAAEKGRIDILYANAGAATNGLLGTVSEEQFDAVIGVNMRGTLFTVQGALPFLRDGASIILKGSIAGVKGRAGRSVYNASKAALRSFARTWANELKDRNIRVNLLSPGPVETGSLAGMSKESMDLLVAPIPRGTIGRPEEIATVALFLASSDSSYVNGTELFADGGTVQV
ncbi:SDR family NAD(P)-dependent oxidoreductase [Caballeronia sp. M23-90]